MELDLDTFLTTVYCLVDEIYAQEFAALKPRRRGRKPEISDSEVLTLGLLAQWQRSRSEREFLRMARKPLAPYFPRWLSQSAFNRRLRDLAGVLEHLAPAIAARTVDLLGPSAYEVLDGVPVPLARRCRGQRHRCFANEAAIARGGSDHDWFFGQRLVLSVNVHGSITGAVSGPANTEEHWLAEALFRWRGAPTAPTPSAAQLDPLLGPTHRGGGHRRGPTGPLSLRGAVGVAPDGVYLGDLGYQGTGWAQHWHHCYGVRVLTKAAYPSRAGRRWFCGLRQIVETVNNWLEERFGLHFPRARSAWGLQTRLAAKLAAFNIALHFNHLFGRHKFTAIELWAQ
jgi:hypothetical protein